MRHTKILYPAIAIASFIVITLTLGLAQLASVASVGPEAAGYELEDCQAQKLASSSGGYHKVYELEVTVYKLLDCVDSDCLQYNAFYNWDFTSKLQSITDNKPSAYTTRIVKKYYCTYDYISGHYICYPCEERKEVDWPMNLVFYGPNLTRSKLDGILKYLDGIAGSQYMYLKPYSGDWLWVDDRGEKGGDSSFTEYGYTYSCTGLSASYVFIHMRVYAPDDNGFKRPSSNITYFIASSHLDVEEFHGGPHGWSECAEEYIADRARELGYTVHEDFWNYHNRIDYNGVAIGLHEILYEEYCDSQYFDEVLTHVYLNNGYATYIYIPGEGG